MAISGWFAVWAGPRRVGCDGAARRSIRDVNITRCTTQPDHTIRIKSQASRTEFPRYEYLLTTPPITSVLNATYPQATSSGRLMNSPCSIHVTALSATYHLSTLRYLPQTTVADGMSSPCHCLLCNVSGVLPIYHHRLTAAYFRFSQHCARDWRIPP